MKLEGVMKILIIKFYNLEGFQLCAKNQSIKSEMKAISCFSRVERKSVKMKMKKEE